MLAGLLALALKSSGFTVQAQQAGLPPGGGPGPQDDGPGHRGQGPPPDGASGTGGWRGHGGTNSTMRGGLQLGPPGRWWDDPDFAASLHLRPEQQTRMDTIFAQNRAALQARYDSLREEERQMQSLTRGAAIDEHTLFGYIDRVSQARAELEKANAHMLLQLRHELSADQITTLDEHRPSLR